MNEIKAFLLNLAGGSLLGIGIGHATRMYFPAISILDNPRSLDNTSPSTAVAKQALVVMARLGAQVFALGTASQYVLPDPQGADPSNGVAALALMLASDPQLWYEVRLLNDMIHAGLMGSSDLPTYEANYTLLNQMIRDGVAASRDTTQ